MSQSDVRDEQRLTAKGRATRDRIVQAAAQLIVTDGLSVFNMENVRQAASVSGRRPSLLCGKGPLAKLRMNDSRTPVAQVVTCPNLASFR